MNYETAIELAHQRMREAGKRRREYHIDVLSIFGTEEERFNGLIIYKAYNEYLYLIDYANYAGLIILSDSAYFNADDYTENTKLQEFTGEIKIIRTGIWSIDGSSGGGVLTGGIGEAPPGGDIRRSIAPVDFLRVVIH